MKYTNSTSTLSIGQIITLVTATSFLFSLIYNWSFFWAINVQLTDMPITINDVIQTALIWSPSVALMLVVSFFVNLFLVRTEHGMSEEELAKASKNRDSYKKRLAKPWVLIKWSSIIGVLAFIFLGQNIYPNLAFIFPMLISLWLFIGNWLSDHPRIKERRNPIFQVLIVIVPIIMGISVSLGYSSSFEATHNNKVIASIHIKNDKTLETLYVRSLEKGILLKLKDKTLTLLPWTEIKKIDKFYVEKKYEGLICKWFDICPLTRPKDRKNN